MTTLEGIDPQMIANNLKPYQPTHPGEVLKDELEEGRIGISWHFAARTGQADRHFLLCFQRDAER